MTRCKASTKSGKRCKLPSRADDDVCTVHLYDDMPPLVPFYPVSDAYQPCGCPHECLDSKSYCCGCRDTRRGDNGYCASCKTRTAVVATDTTPILSDRITQFFDCPADDNREYTAFLLMNEIRVAERDLHLLYNRLEAYIHSTYPLNILATVAGSAIAAESANEESKQPE